MSAVMSQPTNQPSLSGYMYEENQEALG